MASKSSRRELLVGAAATAAGTILASTADAVQTDSTNDMQVNDVIAGIERQLAKPLSEEAKKLMPGAVKNSLNARADRLKFKLPENSEPCTLYVAKGAGK